MTFRPAFDALTEVEPCPWTGQPCREDEVHGTLWHVNIDSLTVIDRCFGEEGQIVQVSPAQPTMRVRWKQPNEYQTDMEPVAALALVERCDGSRSIAPVILGPYGDLLIYGSFKYSFVAVIDFEDGEYR